MVQSELRTLRGVRPTLPSPSPSYTQTVAEDEAAINVLTSEMESLLIDARLRAHPVISTMWERVADDARERLASAASPTTAALSSSHPSPFRADKGILTSAPATPLKIPYDSSAPKMFYSQATSPLSSAFSSISTNGHLRPLDVDVVSLSGSEQLETASATTLFDANQRSRSASPFTPIGSGRSRTASLGSSSTLGRTANAPSQPENEPRMTPILGNPQISRSLGKSSGAKLNQGLGQGNTSSTTGPKFFTSAFSTLQD